MLRRRTAGTTKGVAGLAARALALAAVLSACQPRNVPAPADPMLAALQAESKASGLTYGEAHGRALFLHYCATCHGDEGKGDGQNAFSLNPAPADLAASKAARDPEYLRRVIAQGSAAVGRSSLSPPWGRSLRPQELDDLVLYCRALARPRPGSNPAK